MGGGEQRKDMVMFIPVCSRFGCVGFSCAFDAAAGFLAAGKGQNRASSSRLRLLFGGGLLRIPQLLLTDHRAGRSEHASGTGGHFWST